MKHGRTATLALLTLDFLAAVLVFNLANHFRFIGAPGHLILGTLAAPLVAIFFAIYLIDGYSLRTDMLSVSYTSQHCLALLGAGTGTLLVTYALLPAGFELQSSRIVISISFIALIPLSLIYRRLIYASSLAARGHRSLIFLGDADNYRLFRSECAAMRLAQPVLHTVIHEGSAMPFPGSDREPRTQIFAAVLNEVESGRLEAEAIILRETARELPPDISQRLVALYFRGIPTYTLELFHQVYWRKIPLYRLNQTWLFQEGFQITREIAFERVKRASDVLLSLGGLLATSPLILASAALVWLNDRGPVFFFQTRIGKNGRPFQLAKLRTMRGEPEDGDLYTQTNDPRITRVGHFLRTSRLDELPQLWNVLRGEMSLIGPRAEWDRLVASYERAIPSYHFRHLVKPGITGWAQVNYPYGASLDDTMRKLEYDLYYIRHFSFTLDASIVLKTIHVMLFGKGR